MTPLQVIERARQTALSDEDGDSLELNLLPALSSEGIAKFSETLPCSLPDEIRELLGRTSGFEGVVADVVDFTGRDIHFEFSEAFPHGLPLASDGFGNHWVIDLTPTSTSFGPVYFCCHDAPVLLHQSENLTEFLTELFRTAMPPYQSLVDDVHEDRPFDVWRKNPGVRTQSDCAEDADPDLRAFAAELDDAWEIIDLRRAEPGFGFSWGRYGPRTEVKRHGSEPIFAYRRPDGFFKRLFGGKR